MDTTTTIPFEIAAGIDTYDGPLDLVGFLALRPFVDGTQPMAASIGLERVRADAPLVPANMAPTRCIRAGQGRALLAEGPGWTLAAKVWPNRNGQVTVVAVTQDLADDVLAAAIEGAVEPLDPSDESITIGFWHRSDHGPRNVERSIEAPTWADIAANYEGRARAAVDHLVALDGPPASGRLLLLHGPPGTGKTTILRALARSWKGWCRVGHVIDPEQMLGSAGYLLHVLAEDADEDDRWQLLVLEDCDELIRADAKSDTGQALARLLNVTDGMVGQGLKVLVCITTNERLGQLHPAITRPGRCLAEIEVGPLPGPEARAWLGRDLPDGARSATLAELYAWRDGTAPVSAIDPEQVVGTYL